MKIKKIVSRRTLLQSMGVGVGTLLSPNILWALEAKENHMMIAQKVKKKFAGQKITVLYPKGCVANLSPVVKQFSNLTNVDVHLKEGS